MDADDEVEQRLRIAAGEEDREPGDDHGEERRNRKKEEDDVVRDREQPLDQRHALAEVFPDVGIVDVEVYGLLFIRRRVFIAQQAEVGVDAHREPGQLQVPVVPPARVLASEQDEEHRRQHDDGAESA